MRMRWVFAFFQPSWSPLRSALQHVSSSIRWTCQHWFQPEAGGGYLKLWEKTRLCISVCVCMTLRDRGRERKRDAGLFTIWSIGTIPDEAELVSFLSAYRLLDWSMFFQEDPVVLDCAEMAHTIVRVWSEPMQGVQHPVLKWIDPKWDQQAKSSLFRHIFHKQIKTFLWKTRDTTLYVHTHGCVFLHV